MGSLFVFMVGWCIVYVYVFVSGEKVVFMKVNCWGGVFEFFEVWFLLCLNFSLLLWFCYKISFGKYFFLLMIIMII